MPEGQSGFYIRQSPVNTGKYKGHMGVQDADIVLNITLFSSIFDKDIRRVFIYKKAEHLARALYLIAPAFERSLSLKTGAESVAVALTETASLPPPSLRPQLSRELLRLSGILSIAQTGGFLSAMNAGLIKKEVNALLAELGAYEEPRLSLAESTTISALTKRGIRGRGRPMSGAHTLRTLRPAPNAAAGSTRQDSIVSFIKEKGRVSIKDISLIVRDVSEKTIQRELQGLIEAGKVVKRGERRWSTYEPA